MHEKLSVMVTEENHRFLTKDFKIALVQNIVKNTQNEDNTQIFYKCIVFRKTHN
jgi:hypothetical protein